MIFNFFKYQHNVLYFKSEHSPQNVDVKKSNIEKRSIVVEH